MQTGTSNTPTTFSIFCWNIANPSIKRAEQQAIWLRRQPADVLVLTECKSSEGCLFLERYFRAYGYKVVFPKPEGNEYGVMVVSKHKMISTSFSDNVKYLRFRIASVSLKIPDFPQTFEVIGVYVPSRDSSLVKIERKKRFINSVRYALDRLSPYPYRLFCGDLNVLEPNHIPHYQMFENWEYDLYTALTNYPLVDCFRYLHPEAREYSWVGRTGDGYRYDHSFASPELLPLIRCCYYLHEPQINKLSDHAALITDLALRNVNRRR